MIEKYTVWHLTWEYPPNITGGLGVAVKGLTDALKKDLNVKIFTPRIEKPSAYSCYSRFSLPSEDLDQIVDRLIAGHARQDNAIWDSLQQFTLDVLAVDLPKNLIIHAHDWHSAFAAVALFKRNKVPFVFHLHSTELERSGSNKWSTISQIEQWALCYSKKVINVSTKSLLACCGFSCKSSVVLNSTEIGSGVSKSSSMKTLLFVGRFCGQKSPEMMLEIFRRLKSDIELRLIMVGDGEEMQNVKSTIDFLGLAERVELVGVVAHDEMAKIYQRADLLCLPSVAEPFGLVALEAVSHGLGVILSDRCGVAELLTSAPVIEHRDIDNWVNTVSYYRNNSAAYMGLVSQLQKEAASYTWQDAAKKVVEIYSEVVA